MKALIEGLVTHYAATGALAAACSGLHATLAPAGVEPPICAWTSVSDAPDITSDSFEDGQLIQLTIYSADDEPNEACELVVLLKDAFDESSFALGTGQLVRMIRENERLIPDPDKGWLYSADYRCLCSRKKV